MVSKIETVSHYEVGSEMKIFLWAVFFSFVFSLLPTHVYCLDVTLKQAIGLALKNNPSFRAEEVELSNRVSNVKEKKADYIPRFSLTPSYTLQEGQEENPDLTRENVDYEANITQKIPLGGEISLSYGYSLQSFSSYQSEITRYRLGPNFSIESYADLITVDPEDKHNMKIDLSYTHHLLKDGLVGPAFVPIKEARFDQLIQQEITAGSEIELISEVRTAFYKTVLYQTHVDVNLEHLDISQQILKLIRSRHQIGLSAEIDVMTAQIDMIHSRQELLSSLENLEKSRKELKTLLDIDDQIRAIGQLEMKRSPIGLEEVVTVALKHNRQLLRIEKEIEKQDLGIKVAKNNLLPQVDLFARLKRVGWGISFDQVKKQDYDEYQVGLIFSYPFYNRGLKENYHQRKGELKRLKLKRRGLEMEIKNLVTMLVRQLNLLDTRISLLSKQLEILKGRFDLALQAFEEGLITMKRVYDSRDDLILGEKRHIQVLYEYHRHLSTLQTLMGSILDFG
jgi:outer membrane protein TolC